MEVYFKNNCVSEYKTKFHNTDFKSKLKQGNKPLLLLLNSRADGIFHSKLIKKYLYINSSFTLKVINQPKLFSNLSDSPSHPKNHYNSKN